MMRRSRIAIVQAQSCRTEYHATFERSSIGTMLLAMVMGSSGQPEPPNFGYNTPEKDLR